MDGELLGVRLFRCYVCWLVCGVTPSRPCARPRVLRGASSRLIWRVVEQGTRRRVPASCPGGGAGRDAGIVMAGMVGTSEWPAAPAPASHLRAREELGHIRLPGASFRRDPRRNGARASSVIAANAIVHPSSSPPPATTRGSRPGAQRTRAGVMSSWSMTHTGRAPHGPQVRTKNILDRSRADRRLRGDDGATRSVHARPHRRGRPWGGLGAIGPVPSCLPIGVRAHDRPDLSITVEQAEFV
jgi:hypothetical protein